MVARALAEIPAALHCEHLDDAAFIDAAHVIYPSSWKHGDTFLRIFVPAGADGLHSVLEGSDFAHLNGRNGRLPLRLREKAFPEGRHLSLMGNAYDYFSEVETVFRYQIDSPVDPAGSQSLRLQCAVAHSRSTVWDGEFETVHRWNRFLKDNGIVRHLYYFVCARSCKPILHRLRKS